MLIALFPIKEKSIRLKNKNFKIFCGKSLYLWMLDRLVKNKNIYKIIINTDSDKILKSKLINKKIILRKRKHNLLGHDISMNKIINDDISFIKKTYPNHCKKIHILMTHATNPLLKNKTINKVFNYYKNKLYNNKCDSVFTVNSYQTRFYKKNMKPINHDPKKLIKTQNLKKIYEENSCLYFFSIKSFLKSKNRIGTKAKMYITPFEESIDIDDLQTWKIAKKIFNH